MLPTESGNSLREEPQILGWAGPPRTARTSGEAGILLEEKTVLGIFGNVTVAAAGRRWGQAWAGGFGVL